MPKTVLTVRNFLAVVNSTYLGTNAYNRKDDAEFGFVPTRDSEINENVKSEKIWRKNRNFRGNFIFYCMCISWYVSLQSEKNSDHIQCAAWQILAPALFQLPNFRLVKSSADGMRHFFRIKFSKNLKKSKFTKNRKIFLSSYPFTDADRRRRRENSPHNTSCTISKLHLDICTKRECFPSIQIPIFSLHSPVKGQLPPGAENCN